LIRGPAYRQVVEQTRKVEAMAQTDSLSDFQRRLAAQRRQTERPARERPAAEPKEAKQEAERRTAEQETAAVERQIKVLDEMLPSALRLEPLTFERLKVSPGTPQFDPGPLALAEPAPSWDDFAPVRPGGLSRLFRAGRHAQQVSAARSRFEAAGSEHREKEAERLRSLAIAKATHDREVTEERANAAKRNTYVTGQQSAFAACGAGAVEWFTDRVLDASPYPKVFPREHRVAYRPENRDLVVEFELPPPRIVPSVRAFRYVPLRDAIEPQPRQQSEIKHRYKRLLASVCLRTLHEIFSATPPDVVEAVIFNGRVATIDPATGKPVRPYLVSVSASRAAFDLLVLSAVEPVACLEHLNALISPSPFDLEPVEPFVKAIRGQETETSRQPAVNLLELPPAEFEHLVRQLFVAMGAQGWTPLPSQDGSIGAVATSKNVFFGGVCVMHARRWTGLVGLESVHALAGAMSDHNATTGVLVTTSWFGRASEQFARRNRITLIDGTELSHLIKEHLNRDVIPGTTRAPRLPASEAGDGYPARAGGL
jgi:restriction system protein